MTRGRRGGGKGELVAGGGVLDARGGGKGELVTSGGELDARGGGKGDTGYWWCTECCMHSNFRTGIVLTRTRQKW